MPTKEELYQYYIEENHSRAETAEHFGCTAKRISYLVNRYSLRKIKMAEDFSDVVNRISKSELEKYYITDMHTQAETIEHFSLTSNSLAQLMHLYNLSVSRQLARQKGQLTVIEKYGTKIIDKELLEQYYVVAGHSIKDTCEHFNISSSQLKKLMNKYALKRTDRHRVNNIRNTNLERYGVEFATQSKQARDKAKRSYIEHYGVDHPFKSDLIKEKFKSTCIEHYGVEYPGQSDAIKEKIKNTCLDKYGVEYALQSQDIRNKGKATNLEKYGTEFAIQSEEVQNRIKQACLEKYGVDWPCQLPQCTFAAGDSEPERLFSELLNKYGIPYEREFPIDKYKYDFKINNILIEINPWPTHNSTFGVYNTGPKQKDYHILKASIAHENGYHCICVWDWDNTEKVIKTLLLPKERLYARKCEVKHVLKEDADKFCEEWHLQGKAKASIYIGLYYNDELVSLMSFDKPRYNKNYQYELIRYVSSKNVIGGSEKLWKHFVQEYDPESVISYCDQSKFSGDTYIKLGFDKSVHKVQPSLHWYNQRESKQHITDNMLRQRGFDQLLGNKYGYFGKGTSNEYLMENVAKYVKIYDCGQATYVWKKG